MAESIPPLRITQPDSGFNQIPVFELELSGGTVTKLSPSKVSLAIEGAQGPSGPSGASVVYAPTAGFYLVHSAMDVLTQERVIAGSDNISITNSGTSFLISATTANISGKQDSVTFPLIVASGGTGLSTSGNYANLLGVSDGLVYFAVVASDNVTVTNAGTAIYISANTPTVTAQSGGTVYAPTGGSYITFVADGDLSGEKVFTASDNVVVTTNATTFWVSATTGAKTLIEASNATVNVNSSGATYYISANTSAGAGGSGASTANTYVTLDFTSDLSAELRLVQSGNSVTIDTTGNLVVINANTTQQIDTSSLVANTRTISASSGLTGGGDLSADRQFSVNTNVRDKTLGMFVAGNLSTTKESEEARIYIPFNMEILRVEAAVTTAPTGAAIIVDVNEYPSPNGAGVSIFTADSRPTIAASEFIGTSTGFAVTSFHAGSYLGVDIDQVGSTVAGSNMTITLITRSS